MSDAIKLERSGADPLAPVPKAVKAGDYIFTSSIYPVDDAGGAVTNDPSRGETGPTLMEVQARRCLETLSGVLADFGGWPGGVLKADVHLADADEFHEFKLVWREYFPDPATAPALAYVPSTGIMFDGPLVEIDPTCVAHG